MMMYYSLRTCLSADTYDRRMENTILLDVVMVIVDTLQRGEQALKPPVWYVASRQMLQASDTEARKEGEEQAKARHVMLQEVAIIERVLEEKAKEGKLQFLEYLYKTHPPKQAGQQNHVLNRDDTLKKIMIVAVRQYHPDKNMRDGEKWRLLCDHITKHLNRFWKS